MIPFRFSEAYIIALLAVLCLLVFFVLHHILKYYLLALFGTRNEIIFNESTIEIITNDKKIRTYDKTIVSVVTGHENDVKQYAYFCVQIEHKNIAKVQLKWTHPDSIENFNEVFENYNKK